MVFLKYCNTMLTNLLGCYVNVPLYSLKGFFFSNGSSPRIIWVIVQMYHFELIKCSSSLISHCWSLNWSYICLAWIKILNTWVDFSMHFNYVMHATLSLPLIICQLKNFCFYNNFIIILMYNSIKPNIVQKCTFDLWWLGPTWYLKWILFTWEHI